MNNAKSHPKTPVAAQTQINPEDYVVIKPKGRPPKIQKAPEVLKAIQRGAPGSKFHGHIQVTDASDPPQVWWEKEGNLGIYMPGTGAGGMAESESEDLRG